PRTSPVPRIVALSVLGLIRARRGDPAYAPPLLEAWALAEPTDEMQRLEPAVMARAEAAWLEGRTEDMAAITASTLEIALHRRSALVASELACWRLRAGLSQPIPDGVAGPWALEMNGDWEAAGQAWSRLGCPYEAAMALAGADDEAALSTSLREFQRLEAKPAAAIVARRLRERGARGVPRGPRA